jgi:iron-sulfur cluster repair protein YtfE (RIC family)
MKEDKPEFVQIKKYTLCIEDKPDELKYCCGGKKDIVRPACSLSLKLDELTADDLKDIEKDLERQRKRWS